uniref:Oxidoreductase-like domain-containing protein n=1 Tax=Davidia involucrata TaxID=16924 RepID=A0A5B7CFM2_DAVIN
METAPYHQYLRGAPSSPLAMRDMTLRRITANRITVYRRSHHHPKLFCVNNTTLGGTMADEANKKSQLGDESSKLKNEAEKQPEESPPLPPPPEKPLPGDCCGSGCVRCVWDVYYDELEAYNNLCNSNSKPKPS